MRLLVTGTSGFIGTTLCEILGASPKYRVIGVDRIVPREEFPYVEYLVVDLKDANEVMKIVRRYEPDCIIHFAAQARVEPSLKDPIGTYRDNVVATMNLLEAALSLGNKFDRFFYASSETVYGRAETYPTPEDSPLRPISPYAASKAAAETLVRSTSGLRTVVLRSAMGYGPRSSPKEQVVARFITNAIQGKPLRFPAGFPVEKHPTRDLNFVENFVHGVKLAIDSGVEGVFNIGSGREMSILDLAYLVVNKVGSGQVVFDSSFQYREGEAGLRVWLDIHKAMGAFGYVPPISLSEGLQKTIDWIRSHPNYWG